LQLIDLCSCCLDVHRLELKEELQAVSTKLILVSLNYIIQSAVQNQWIEYSEVDSEESDDVLDTRSSMSFYGKLYLASSTIMEETGNAIESIISSGEGRVSALDRDRAYLLLDPPSGIIITDKQFIKTKEAYSNCNDNETKSDQTIKPTKLIQKIIDLQQAFRCPIISRSSFIDCVRRASTNLPAIIQYIPLYEERVKTKDKEIQGLKDENQKLNERIDQIIVNRDRNEERMKQQLNEKVTKINQLNDLQLSNEKKLQQLKQQHQQQQQEQQQQQQQQQAEQQAEQQRLTNELQVLQGRLEAANDENKRISQQLNEEQKKNERLDQIIANNESNEQDMKKQLNEKCATIDRLNELQLLNENKLLQVEQQQLLNEQQHQEQLQQLQVEHDERQVEQLLLEDEFLRHVEMLSSVTEENKQLNEKVEETTKTNNELTEQLNAKKIIGDQYETIIALKDEAKKEADKRSKILYYRFKIQESIHKQTTDKLRSEQNESLMKIQEEVTLGKAMNTHLCKFVERIEAEVEVLRKNKSQIVVESTKTAQEAARARVKENDEHQERIINHYARQIERLTSTFM
jgi:hypothetical protein